MRAMCVMPLAVATLAAVPVAAQPARPASGVKVEVHAPDGCPGGDDVAELVADHLGRTPAPDDRLTADVVVERTADGHRARVRIWRVGGRAERVIAGGSCAEVADAAALVVALAVEPRRGVAVPGSEPPSAPSSDPVRALPPPESDMPSIAVHAGATGGVGMLPGADVGVAGGLGLVHGRWELGLEVGSWLARRASVGDDVGADVDVWTIAARGCAHARPAFACAVGEVGRMRGNATGYDEARSGEAGWGAVGLGAGLGWEPAPSWRLFGRLDGLISVGSPRFVMSDGTELHEPSRLCGRLTLGIAAELF